MSDIQPCSTEIIRPETRQFNLYIKQHRNYPALSDILPNPRVKSGYNQNQN